MKKNKLEITTKNSFKQGTNLVTILTILLILSFILNIYLFFIYRDLKQKTAALQTEIESLKETQKGETKMPDSQNPLVKMETSKGEFIIELYPDIAPKTVNNFLEKVNAGNYNGLTFHRIIKGFMIQGGCPKGDGTGGNLLPFEGSNLKHTPGVISMAATQGGKNQSDSQFFIMHGTSTHLDGVYTAFGKVSEGWEVVEAIANSPVSPNRTGENSAPVEKIVIIKAELLTP